MSAATERKWIENPPPSYLLVRPANVSPMGFVDVFAAIAAKVHPEWSVGLHNGTQLQMNMPHVSISLRHRVRDNQIPKEKGFSRGYVYKRYRFTNTMRFRMYCLSMAEAEEQGWYLEKFMMDYRANLRHYACDDIRPIQALGYESDPEGRIDNTFHVAKDYTVILGEIIVVRDEPIKSVTLGVSVDTETIKETVDSTKYKLVGGVLDNPPIFVYGVDQGPSYTYVEGLDYTVTPAGIEWLMENPPMPYYVTYSHLAPERVLELEQPAELAGRRAMS